MQSSSVALPLPAPEPTAERPPSPARRLAISARFLLGIYIILPLCWLAMLLDHLCWGGTFFRSLANSPEHYFVFQLLFGTPHILASAVLLAANGDYLRTYYVRLALFTLVILLFFGVGSLFLSYDVFLAIVGAATVLHVIKQQVGIGKGVCRLASWLYDLWGWTLIAVGSLLYYTIYTESNLTADTRTWINGGLWTLSALALALTLACQRRIASGLGRLYLWANALMVLQSVFFFAQGYAFLAILGPRLVHDVTAFTFYVVHDMNRHGTQPRNVLYRLAGKLRLGIGWVCPVLAVLLTYLIDRYLSWQLPFLGDNMAYPVSFLLVGYLGLLHYYTEAFTWKHGSPYRRYIAMTA